jgi:hypothetical protein
MTYTVTQYRDEFVAAFEKRQSLLRDVVTTEAVIKGNQATFLVSGSGSEEAVTRGVSGDIPYYTNTNTQYTATLSEWHAPFEMTGFDIFQAQSNQKQIMQMNSMALINRQVDNSIRTALSAATLTLGAAQTASLRLVTKAKAALGVNLVPNDGGICFLVSPAFINYMMEVTEFGSNDYIDNRPLQDGGADWTDKPKVYKFAGASFIEDPQLAGVGTSSETCYAFHKSAIGHAMDTSGLGVKMGYDDKQDKSWTRATGFMGGKLLQNTGVIKILHDGSAMVAS